jgi:uncharacterized protein (TIGR03435 family)
MRDMIRVKHHFLPPAARRLIDCLAWLAFCTMPTFAQPAFEVASLKPSQPTTGANPRIAQLMAESEARMFDGHPLGWLPIQQTRLVLKNQNLAGLIASAYRVRMWQVSGPAWTTEDRYDIEATFPSNTPHVAVNDMLRTLLEERFSLKTHRDEKEEAGFALVEIKDGVKLTPAAPNTGEAAAPVSEEDRSTVTDKMRAEVQKRIKEMQKEAANGAGGDSWHASATLAELADWLTPLLGRPVVDATSLPGKYDFTIDIRRFGDDTEEYAAGQALAKLGLKLVARKITVPRIVIDQVDRTPKPN